MRIDLKIGQWEYQGYEPPEEQEWIEEDTDKVVPKRKIAVQREKH